jgi:hypothetical protein
VRDGDASRRYLGHGEARPWRSKAAELLAAERTPGPQVKELGRGCFGSVWLAKWRGVEVAIKEMLQSGHDTSPEEVRGGLCAHAFLPGAAPAAANPRGLLDAGSAWADMKSQRP